jgi:hypothetical protein
MHAHGAPVLQVPDRRGYVHSKLPGVQVASKQGAVEWQGRQHKHQTPTEVQYGGVACCTLHFSTIWRFLDLGYAAFSEAKLI